MRHGLIKQVIDSHIAAVSGIKAVFVYAGQVVNCIPLHSRSECVPVANWESKQGKNLSVFHETSINMIILYIYNENIVSPKHPKGI